MASSASPAPRRLDDGAPALDRERAHLTEAPGRGSLGRVDRDPLHVRSRPPRARPAPRRRRRAGSPGPARRSHRRSGAPGAGPRSRPRWPSGCPPSLRGTGCPQTAAELLPGRRAHAEPARGRADDVAEHGAGLDRGQLLGVADEDQAGVGADRLEQPGHQRERHHGGLVDHDDVVGQPVEAVWRNRVRLPGLKPSSRCSVVPSSVASRSRTSASTAMAAAPARTASSSRAAAFPSVRPARSAAAGLPPRPPAPRAAPGRGPPWSSCPCRAAGDHRHPAQHGRRRRHALEVRVVGLVEQLRQAGRQAGPRRRRRAGSAARCSRSAATWHSSSQRRSRYRFVPQVERDGRHPTSGLAAMRRRATSAGPARAARRGRPACRCRRSPCARWSRGRRRRGPAVAPERRRRRRGSTTSSVAPLEPCQPQGDVHVGGGQDPASVERVQRARCAERQTGVEGVGPLHLWTCVTSAAPGRRGRSATRPARRAAATTRRRTAAPRRGPARAALMPRTNR